MLPYTNSETAEECCEHILNFSRIYPSVEFRRSRDNGRKLKHYNSVVVMLEVNHLALLSEVELVKRQALCYRKLSSFLPEKKNPP